MKAGDLVGFSGACFLSDMVNIATLGIPRFGISHVGIVAPEGQGLALWESTEHNPLPDLIAHRIVKGVQVHELDLAVENYQGKVYLYPLYRELYQDEQDRLAEFLASMYGRGYDEIGAIRSAGVGLSYIESLLHPENLSSIFCSEMVAKAYSELGLLPTHNASRWSPNRLVRRLRRRSILLPSLRLK